MNKIHKWNRLPQHETYHNLQCSRIHLNLDFGQNTSTTNTEQEISHTHDLWCKQNIPCWNTQPAKHYEDGLVPRRRKVNSLAAIAKVINEINCQTNWTSTSKTNCKRNTFTSSSSTKVLRITSISHVKTSQAMKGNLNRMTKLISKKVNFV